MHQSQGPFLPIDDRQNKPAIETACHCLDLSALRDDCLALLSAFPGEVSVAGFCTDAKKVYEVFKSLLVCMRLESDKLGIAALFCS